MKIKKTFQGQLPENKIVNTESSSQTDTYSCKYINEKVKEVYSTEEQVIGTWMGKTLYRKTVYVDNLPNNEAKAYTLNISNLEYITNYYGVVYKNTTFVAINNNRPMDSKLAIGVYINVEGLIIETGSDRSDYVGYITLEYTKTTD